MEREAAAFLRGFIAALVFGYCMLIIIGCSSQNKELLWGESNPAPQHSLDDLGCVNFKD